MSCVYFYYACIISSYFRQLSCPDILFLLESAITLHNQDLVRNSELKSLRNFFRFSVANSRDYFTFSKYSLHNDIFTSKFQICIFKYPNSYFILQVNKFVHFTTSCATKIPFDIHSSFFVLCRIFTYYCS